MSNLSLYNYYRSSTSYRVRIALEHKEIKYDYIPVHLLNNGGEQNATTYRALNPLGGVPTLKHDNKIISQSFAIIDYLGIFPQKRLFPEDIFLRAKVRQVCEIINADIHPLQNLKVMQHLETQYGFTAEQKKAWISKWVADGLQAVEKTIENFSGNFCFGDHVTAADLFLVPQLFSAERFQVDFSHLKLISKINRNCLTLESFKRAHPYRQPDTPADQRIE